MTLRRTLPGIAVAIVAVGILFAFWSVGAPWSNRQTTLDELRIGDLYRIADHFRDAHNRHEELPAQLPAFIPTPYGRSDDRPVVRDPVTSKPYVYKRLDSIHYALCARFSTSTLDKRHSASPSARYWAHPDGTKCFSLDSRTVPPLPDISIRVEPINEF